MKIFNFYARNTYNIGDRSCAPHLYSYLPMIPLDHQDDLGDINEQAVVIGGGGLVSRCFEQPINRLVQAGPARIVVWGVGSNYSLSEHAGYPEWFGAANLIGVRDWSNGYRYLPCASCLSPLFKKRQYIRYRIVQYCHAVVNNMPTLPVPQLSNATETLEEVIAFLSSAEIVVTNTYHGMYWATLLGKRVVAFPFATRFLHFKYDCPLMVGGDLEHAISKAVSYPNALDECIEINKKFEEDVANLLW
jgi:hypothetical protein